MVHKHNNNDDFDYRLLFTKSPDASLIIKNNIIIECNKAAMHILGYSSVKDIIDKNILNLSYQDNFDRGSSTEVWNKMIDHTFEKNDHATFEWEFIHRKGMILNHRIILVPLSFDRKILAVLIKKASTSKDSEKNNKSRNNTYQSMFERNHAIMLLVNPNTGEIVDANPAACYFYGYEKERFLTMKVFDLGASSSDEISSRLKDVKSHRGKHYYLKDRLADGSIRDVEIFSGPIMFNGCELVYAIIHDVTEKNQALEALRENEKKFKELFNNANDLIFLNDINEAGIPAEFIEVNDVACERLGYSREELLKMTPIELNEKEARGKISEVEREIKINGHYTFETTILSKAGQRIPVEVSSHTFELEGRPVDLSIARDITERKGIEISLRESKEKYKKLLDFLPEAVIVIDNNTIRFANDAAAKFFGFNSYRDVMKKKLLDLIAPEDISQVNESIYNLPKEYISRTLMGVRFKKENGKIAYGEMVHGKVLFNKEPSIMIVIRDMTEQMEAKIMLAETIQYDNLKTEFFANISHELRTPLNVIFGAIQLLEFSMKQSETGTNSIKIYHNSIKSMKQNCYRLLRLVNNIIDITKIDSGYYEIELQNYDIVNLVENIAMSVVEYMETRGITLEFDTEVEEKIIQLDPEKIERIMLNLLANSIKFTKSGGKVKVFIYEEAENVVISVSDTGIGIPANKKDIIFDRFRQVDKSLTRNHEGSGIGLSIVKALIELHGGTITVESELGCGSEFIITLPGKVLPGSKTKTMYKENKHHKIETINIEFSDIYA